MRQSTDSSKQNKNYNQGKHGRSSIESGQSSSVQQTTAFDIKANTNFIVLENMGEDKHN